MGIQLLAIVATIAFAGLGTWGILALVQATIGARADVPEESAGLDLSQHGEEAYFGSDLGSSVPGMGGSLGGSVVVETFSVEPAAAPARST
jgi:Amt family ammonium transporter